MPIFKREKSKYWQVKFTAPNGKVIYESTKTTDRALADEYEVKRRHELYRVYQLGDRPVMKWEAAVVRYIEESESKRLKDNVSIFRILHPYFSGTFLHHLDRSHIDALIAGRKADGVKPATINKALEKVRALFNKAKDEWKVKIDPPKIKLFKVPKGRVRWLKKNEAIYLMRFLEPHTRDMMHLTLETGLRESNITFLRWDQVDLINGVIYIEGDDVLKDGIDYTVVLSEAAKDIIKRQIGSHEERVFTYRNKPIKKAETRSWRKAMKRAEIEDFRWHDLRHTWATWHVQSGTPLEVLQVLGGWSDIKMVQIYAHFNVETLKKFVTDSVAISTEKVAFSLHQKEKAS